MFVHCTQSICRSFTVGCSLPIVLVNLIRVSYTSSVTYVSWYWWLTICRSVSTKVEQFTEISLNISSHTDTQTINSDSQIQILSLVDCLEQFTRAEHLGSTVKIECSKCNMQQESTKQLTVNKLPIVICFHLKVCKYLLRFFVSNLSPWNVSSCHSGSSIQIDFTRKYPHLYSSQKNWIWVRSRQSTETRR